MAINPLLLSTPLYSQLLFTGLVDSPTLRTVSKQLLFCRNQLNLLERWQLLRYKEAGFLGWVARFILQLTPSSQVRLLHIDTLERLIKRLSYKLAQEPQDKPHAATAVQQVAPTSLALKADRPIDLLPATLTEKTSPCALDLDIAVKQSDVFLKKKQSTLALLSSDKIKISQIDADLLDDKEFILSILGQQFYTLHFASMRLKADKEIILAGVQQNGQTLTFAADELRADKEIVLAAVKQSGLALQYASSHLQANKEVVLAAIKQNAFALKFAAFELLADKEMVLAAVQQNGQALQFASPYLQADKEVVRAAATRVVLKSD